MFLNITKKKMGVNANSMRLSFPKEPLELKAKAYDSYKSNPMYNMDSWILWKNQAFPKYLWKEWGDILKNEYDIGYREFLKILKFNKLELRKWARKEITWETYIKEIIRTIPILKRSFLK